MELRFLQFLLRLEDLWLLLLIAGHHVLCLIENRVLGFAHLKDSSLAISEIAQIYIIFEVI
jgi:hypothetical protein